MKVTRTASSSTLLAAGTALLLATAAVSQQQPRRAEAAYGVDDAALVGAAGRTGDWLTYGGTYKEQRYSTLDQINDGNVDQLGIAWVQETNTKRGLEATPLIVDGVMYATGAWNVIYAMDAVTGEPLWTYDPEVPRSIAMKTCCDAVNRGAALYRGKVISATLDGRLIAIDAETGELAWSTMTVPEDSMYTITGAPRIAKGKVIIGNSGAEYGVRGYVDAYDAETGERAWRFYTVPGNPADGFENEAMRMAAETWTGEWWTGGGGGTVWDSIVYDPELDLLYIGVGNGAPWDRNLRSPGGGDNLFLSSIVALRPDTGEYVWHYQTTPGDTWDYTATQPIMLAELPIGGQVRQVLMQAPKNGFFYVLDRRTGELISAEEFVTVTWASHVDLATGRPVELAGARYTDQTVNVMPGPLGGHNWHPMAFSPKTGLVYIPAMEMGNFYVPDPNYEYTPGQWNLGVRAASPEDIPQAIVDATGLSAQMLAEDAPPALLSGHLLAWDPVAQREVWRAQYTMPWSGGTLATAGNLVFQGTPFGQLTAYRADDGEKLWESYTGSGVIAPPITFESGGTQYIAVMSGWGGAFGIVGSRSARQAVESEGRIVVYALGATGRAIERQERREIRVARVDHGASTEDIDAGRRLFNQYCLVCHGYGAVSGGVTPDLRQSSQRVFDSYEAALLEGALVDVGMPSFAPVLDRDDVALLKAYVLHRRNMLADEQDSQAP